MLRNSKALTALLVFCDVPSVRSTLVLLPYLLC